jgi:hypothetical protein
VGLKNKVIIIEGGLLKFGGKPELKRLVNDNKRKIST